MSTGRELIIKILGDSKSAEHALESVSKKSEHLGGKFGGLTKAAALVGGVAGVGLVVEGLKGCVEAASSAQTSQAALDQALRATHQSVKAMSPALEEAAKKSRDLGFSDIDTEHALTRLEIATGNTKQSIKDLSVAQDIARVKHMSLESASQMLAQAMTGSQRAAKQLGIVVNTTSTNVDELKRSHEDLTTATGKADLAHAKLMDKMATGQAVIAAVTDKVHGQADAYANTAAGSMARFHAATENLQVMIGTKLIPILTSLVDGLLKVVNYIEAHWSQISAVFDKVGNVIKVAWDTVLHPVLKVFLAIATDIYDFIHDNWPTIETVTKTTFNAVKTAVNDAKGAVEAVTTAFRAVDTWVTSQLGGVKTGLVNAFNDVKTPVVDVKNAVGDVLGKLGDLMGWTDKNAGKIGAAFGAIGSAIAAAIKAPINAVIDLINGFHLHIPGLKLLGHQIIPDVDFNFPDIPHLAQGGIVNKPTLAVIGESGPEAVVPLNRGGFGGGITINMYGDSYGIEDFADKAHAALLRKRQSMGPLGLS